MSQKKINIIIADDNPQFTEALVLLLSKNPEYTILDICKNGQELINSEKLWHADLLLIDIEMPEIDGLKAAKTINFKRPELPMIAITMYKEKVYLLDIINAGFKGFVHKPDTYNELFQVIRSVLNDRYVFPKNLNIDHHNLPESKDKNSDNSNTNI